MHYNKNNAACCALWKKVIADDHNAYNKLHTALYPLLHDYLSSIVKDDDLANDLLQELFIKLWNKRKQIGVMDNVKSYFFTASRLMAIDHIRKIKVQNAKIDQYTFTQIVFSAEDNLVFAEENVKLSRKMKAALNNLTVRQREIIHLKYYQGMEYEKIAALTGIRYQSVINHAFRGLQTLRTEFRHYERIVA